MILYSKQAKKYIDKLHEPMRSKIKNDIEKFWESEEKIYKNLAGYNSSKALRIGKYRVIFIVEHGMMRVEKIESRGDVYKGGYW